MWLEECDSCISFTNVDMDLLKEADLVGHLKNTDKKEKSKEKKDQMAKRLENDYQLSEALNLLKGLNIISSK